LFTKVRSIFNITILIEYSRRNKTMMGDKEARAAYEKMVQNMMNNYGEHNTGEYNTGRTLTAEEVLQNRYGRNADAANKPL
jgi:hypothetical protein